MVKSLSLTRKQEEAMPNHNFGDPRTTQTLELSCHAQAHDFSSFFLKVYSIPSHYFYLLIRSSTSSLHNSNTSPKALLDGHNTCLVNIIHNHLTHVCWPHVPVKCQPHYSISSDADELRRGEAGLRPLLAHGKF